MQLRQAMADLAEVRGRLATVQRFDGYSAWAAIASGGLAIPAGAVQYALIRTVGMIILPAIAAGAVITLALVTRGLFDLLPGMWCATYALGLFSSRAMVPRNA